MSTLVIFLYSYGRFFEKKVNRKNDGIILGINSASGVESINHSLFADDTFILVWASLKMERVFLEIMHHFCIISGALINIRESVVYGWNVDQSIVTNISHILGFEGFAS